MARNKRNKKSKNKSQASAWREPSPAASIYKGPIVRPFDKEESDLHTVLLPYTEFISSSAGGKITNVYSDNPSAFPDWSSLAAIYDEYRVLGFRVEFFPNNRYSKTTTTCRPLVVVVDRNDVGALATYSAAVAYSSAEKESLEDPWTREVRMESIEDAGFTLTSSTTAHYYVKLYADGLTNLTEYGMVVLYALTQFRGRN